MKLIEWVLLTCALLMLLACERVAPSSPPGVRIATTSPAVGVMLRDFNAASLAVGRSGYDVALDPMLPVVGDMAGFDLERLSTLGATHVFVETGASAPPAGLREVSDSAGFELVAFELTSLAQLIELAERVYAMVSPHVDAGPAPQTRFEAALRRDDSLARAGPVLLLIPGSSPAALGPGSVHHEVLMAMGATPAISTGRPYMPLDAEDLIELSPKAIVLLAPEKDEPWETLLGPLAELQIPACDAGRVVVLRDADVLMASTSTLRFAEAVRSNVRRWAEDR